MASANTPYNYDTGDAAAQYSFPPVGEDGPGNTTADSGGGPGDAAAQYSGGFVGAPNDAVDQTWRDEGKFTDGGPSSAQYSSPAPSEVVNRSSRYQTEAQE